MSKLLHGLWAGMTGRNRSACVEAARVAERVGTALRPLRRLLGAVSRRRLLMAIGRACRNVRVRMSRGMAAGLQLPPMTIIRLSIRRRRAIALLREAALLGLRRLLLPAVRLLRRLRSLSLRVNPRGLARTLRVCGAGNWPPRVRPWKSVLRGHRENPLIPAAGTARVRLMIRDFNASRRAPRHRGSQDPPLSPTLSLQSAPSARKSQPRHLIE